MFMIVLDIQYVSVLHCLVLGFVTLWVFAVPFPNKDILAPLVDVCCLTVTRSLCLGSRCGRRVQNADSLLVLSPLVVNGVRGDRVTLRSLVL